MREYEKYLSELQSKIDKIEKCREKLKSYRGSKISHEFIINNTDIAPTNYTEYVQKNYYYYPLIVLLYKYLEEKGLYNTKLYNRIKEHFINEERNKSSFKYHYIKYCQEHDILSSTGEVLLPEDMEEYFLVTNYDRKIRDNFYNAFINEIGIYISREDFDGEIENIFGKDLNEIYQELNELNFAIDVIMVSKKVDSLTDESIKEICVNYLKSKVDEITKKIDSIEGNKENLINEKNNLEEKLQQIITGTPEFRKNWLKQKLNSNVGIKADFDLSAYREGYEYSRSKASEIESKKYYTKKDEVTILKENKELLQSDINSLISFCECDKRREELGAIKTDLMNKKNEFLNSVDFGEITKGFDDLFSIYKNNEELLNERKQINEKLNELETIEKELASIKGLGTLKKDVRLKKDKLKEKDNIVNALNEVDNKISENKNLLLNGYSKLIKQLEELCQKFNIELPKKFEENLRSIGRFDDSVFVAETFNISKISEEISEAFLADINTKYNNCDLKWQKELMLVMKLREKYQYHNTTPIEFLQYLKDELQKMDNGIYYYTEYREEERLRPDNIDRAFELIGEDIVADEEVAEILGGVKKR